MQLPSSCCHQSRGLQVAECMRALRWACTGRRRQVACHATQWAQWCNQGDSPCYIRLGCWFGRGHSDDWTELLLHHTTQSGGEARPWPGQNRQSCALLPTSLPLLTDSFLPSRSSSPLLHLHPSSVSSARSYCSYSTRSSRALLLPLLPGDQVSRLPSLATAAWCAPDQRSPPFPLLRPPRAPCSPVAGPMANLLYQSLQPGLDEVRSGCVTHRRAGASSCAPSRLPGPVWGRSGCAKACVAPRGTRDPAGRRDGGGEQAPPASCSCLAAV